jgi:hypothetical protein
MEDRRRFGQAERARRGGEAEIEKPESGMAVRAGYSSYRVRGPIQGEMKTKNILKRASSPGRVGKGPKAEIGGQRAGIGGQFPVLDCNFVAFRFEW